MPFSDCVNEVREQERAPRAPLKERAGHESGYENMAHGQLLCIYAALVYCCVRAFSDMCSCVGEAGMCAQHTFGNQAGGRDTIGSVCPTKRLPIGADAAGNPSLCICAFLPTVHRIVE